MTCAVCLWKQSTKTFHSFQTKQKNFSIIPKMMMDDMIYDDVNDNAVNNDDDEIEMLINTTMILITRTQHTFSGDAS